MVPDTKLLSKIIKEDDDHENRDGNAIEDVKKREIFKTFQFLPPAKGPDPSLRKGPNDKILL